MTAIFACVAHVQHCANINSVPNFRTCYDTTITVVETISLQIYHI